MSSTSCPRQLWFENGFFQSLNQLETILDSITGFWIFELFATSTPNRAAYASAIFGDPKLWRHLWAALRRRPYEFPRITPKLVPPPWKVVTSELILMALPLGVCHGKDDMLLEGLKQGCSGLCFLKSGRAIELAGNARPGERC